MRPKLFTLKNLALVLAAVTIFTSLALWASKGFPLPFGGVPSTADKVAFVLERDGQSDLYLADAKTHALVRLTQDPALEGELVFSPDGQKLAYTANRGGSVRQVCLTEAGPDRKVISLTRTQSTKEQPLFENSDQIYFLDSGKIARTASDASDADAIFPTVESKRSNQALSTLFAEGGIARYCITPDGKSVLAAVKRERNEVLVLYSRDADAHASGSLVVIGFARKLHFQFVHDGSLAVLFQGGTPLPQPLEVPVPKDEEEGKAVAGQLEQMLSEFAGRTDSLEAQTILVHFDMQLKVNGGLPVPFPADDFRVAPNDQTVALFSTEAVTGKPVGIYLGSFTNPEESFQRISEAVVDSLSWSPDGSQFAFVSKNDLFVYSIKDASAPVNVTQGKGKASWPAWSPAKPEQK